MNFIMFTFMMVVNIAVTVLSFHVIWFDMYVFSKLQKIYMTCIICIPLTLAYYIPISMFFFAKE